jgi:hypothetical protein
MLVALPPVRFAVPTVTATVGVVVGRGAASWVTRIRTCLVTSSMLLLATIVHV